ALSLGASQPAVELTQPARTLARGLERGVGEVGRGPVVRRGEQRAHRARLDVILLQVARGEEVAESLAHLRAAHGEELTMHPHARELRLTGVRATLCDLILVMREDEVDATG